MSDALRCPRCPADLRSAMAGATRVWNCPACGGVALGVAALRKIAPKARVDGLWADVFRAPADGAPCTSCRRAMRRAARIVGERTVGVEACVNCQFVWFDAGSIAAFSPERQTAPRPGAEDGMSQEARQAIAIEKVHARPIGAKDEGDKALSSILDAGDVIEISFEVLGAIVAIVTD